MTLKELLKQIKCKKTLLGKSCMTSGNAYRITLTHKGKKCQFIFNDNCYNKSRKSDFLYCLVLDSQAYEYSRDMNDFIKSFGYLEDEKLGKKAYDSCMRQYTRLHRLFNESEIDLLATIE